MITRHERSVRIINSVHCSQCGAEVGQPCHAEDTGRVWQTSIHNMRKGQYKIWRMKNPSPCQLLIAAAPDLLAACRAADAAITYETAEAAEAGQWDLPLAVAMLLRSAILKAEGRS